MLEITFVSRQKLSVQLQKWMTLTTSYPNRNSITSITIRPYILNYFWKVLSPSLLCWNCFFLKSLIQESLEAENYSQRGYQRLPWIFIFETIIPRKLSLVIVLNNQLRKLPQTYDVMWEKNIPRKSLSVEYIPNKSARGSQLLWIYLHISHYILRKKSLKYF